MTGLDLPDTAETELHQRLSDHFPIQGDELECVEQAPTGVNANKGNHLVARYDSDVSIGLKAADRVDEGTDREEALGRIAEMLGIRGAAAGVRIDPIQDLGGLDGKEFVATRWNPGKSLDQLTPDERENISDDPDAFLENFGQWLAFCLLFSVQDDKPAHWIWDDENDVLTHVDNESSLQNHQSRPNQFKQPVAVIGILDQVKQGGTSEKNAVERGIRQVVGTYRDREEEVTDLLAEIGEANHASDWMDRDPDAFVEQALAGL